MSSLNLSNNQRQRNPKKINGPAEIRTQDLTIQLTPRRYLSVVRTSQAMLRARQEGYWKAGFFIKF